MHADDGDAVEESDEEDEDDDVLVVLELTDFKNHPIFDDYRSIKIEGIDTASPMLTIGEYTLHGQLEETVGTNFFYDTKNRTEQNHYQYVGQTTKKIKFTISPPEP
uniref:Transcription factor TFIIIC triple barrel domain-containing protein n=1 Tax=Globisporangium ultimum (strain ATCC 200006 / CBS 805.95 / DAOM BR144) TaxID=431595 RepID=K3WSF1_GLOUD